MNNTFCSRHTHKHAYAHARAHTLEERAFFAKGDLIFNDLRSIRKLDEGMKGRRGGGRDDDRGREREEARERERKRERDQNY